MRRCGDRVAPGRPAHLRSTLNQPGQDRRNIDGSRGASDATSTGGTRPCYGKVRYIGTTPVRGEHHPFEVMLCALRRPEMSLTSSWSGRRDSNPRPSPWQGDANFRWRPLQPLESRTGGRVFRWSRWNRWSPLHWSSRWSSRPPTTAGRDVAGSSSHRYRWIRRAPDPGRRRREFCCPRPGTLLGDPGARPFAPT
jgi:hypothetical protein